MNARPFVKWPGGKHRLANDILPRLAGLALRPRGRYFEPFVGGGGLFWRASQTFGFSSVVLSDANAELVTTYRAIRNDVESVISALRWHSDCYARGGADYYYAMRAESPEQMGPTFCAARMIFLNKRCFCGLYRVNNSGAFNVTHGKPSSKWGPICDAENLRACSAALQDVLILVASFDAVMRGLSPTTMPSAGDLVYLDPPYEPEPGKKSFTAYTAGGASPTLQEDVARTFRELDARGVYVVASNSNTPRVRELYSGFRMVELSRSGGMNSDTTKRQPVPELLILGRGCS